MYLWKPQFEGDILMAISEKNVTFVKYGISFLGVLSAIYIGVCAPFDGLTSQGAIALGVFWCAIILWVTDVFPDFITGMLMLGAWALFKAAPFPTVYSAFSSTTIWLLVGAFGMAAAIGKSGLLNRLALFLMTKFPLSFKGQTLGLMLTSLAIAPMVPSTATKSAILGPLSKTISDNMGFERQSKGAVGVFSAMYMPTCVLYSAFLSASFMCYMMLGLLPQESQAGISWVTWFLYSLVWLVVVGVLSFLFIQFYYAPKNVNAVAGDELMKRRQALGKLSSDEKIVMVVLCIAFILWVTEPLHKISSAIVTIGAMSALTITGVINRKDFRTAIPWDLVLFIGAVACSGPVFKTTGLDAFFAAQLGPYIIPLLDGNFVLFIIIYSMLVWAIRFVITSQTAALTILILLLSPVALKLNIHPWIIGFITYISSLLWITKYQNVTYITAAAMIIGEDGKKDLIQHKQVIPLSLCFMVSSVIGFIVSIPFWKMLGLM